MDWYELMCRNGTNMSLKVLWKMRNVKYYGTSQFRLIALIGARRPDITIFDKERRKCQLIDIACPGDNRVAEKEDEKIDKYRDLAREVSKLWNVKVEIIPVVIGALGTIPKLLESRIKDIGISIKTAQIQKPVLLGTARILRKVLEI